MESVESGLSVGGVANHWILRVSLILLVFGLGQSCGRAPTAEPAARRFVERVVRNQLSPAVTLDPGLPAAVTASAVVVCADAECAVFYLTGLGEGCRVVGVKLTFAGELLPSSRVDFGRAGLCTMEAVTAAGKFVLAMGAPRRLLLLNPLDLHIERDFSESPFAAHADHLYASGSVVIVADVDSQPAKSQVLALDVTSGIVTEPAPLGYFWVPLVIPGDGQFLFFYPNSGAFARLSASTGQWLGDFQTLTSNATRVFSFNAVGFYRQGTYHVAFHQNQPDPPATRAEIFGFRVDAASGQLLDTAAGQPAPQILCEACPGGLGGAYQTQAAAFLWLQTEGNDHPLVQLDPQSGKRADPSLLGPDLQFTTLGLVWSLAPSDTPRFAVVDGAIYRADPAHPAGLVTGNAMLPGKSSGLSPGQVVAASNGESFLVAWDRDPQVRAALVKPANPPELGIREILTRDLDLPTALSAASAGKDYLLVGLQRDPDQSPVISRQLLTGDGQLGPVSNDATGLTRGSGEDAILRVVSDGQRYLLVLFIGSVIRDDGRIYVQRLDAAGQAEEPLWLARSDVAFFDRVEANFADPPSERQFAILYYKFQGNFATHILRVPSSGGALSEPLELGRNDRALANDGRELLLGAGPTKFRVLDGRETSLAVTDFDQQLVSQWDGTAYVSVQKSEGLLTVDRLDEAFHSPSPTEVSREFVGDFALSNDGHGQSLIAYYAAEAPEHLLELHAALYRTDDELVAVGGAGGAAGAGEAGQGPLVEAAGTAGAPEFGSDGGERSATGGAGGAGGDAAIPDGPTAPVSDGNHFADPRSRACGCGVPTRSERALVLPLVLLLSLFVRRQRRQPQRKFRAP